jgi:hypothetical protein
VNVYPSITRPPAGICAVEKLFRTELQRHLHSGRKHSAVKLRHQTRPSRTCGDGVRHRPRPIGDPSGRDAALSCGAVLEAMVLALSAHDIAARATLTNKDTSLGQGLVAVAHLTL